MKINTFVKDLKAKSVAELNEELVAAKKELFKALYFHMNFRIYGDICQFFFKHLYFLSGKLQ